MMCQVMAIRRQKGSREKTQRLTGNMSMFEPKITQNIPKV